MPTMRHTVFSSNFKPLDPKTWISVLRCPACLGRLVMGDRAVCRGCEREYPISGGIPYLSIIDEHWHDNLREIINYVYFYEKLVNRHLERDRLQSNPEHQQATFQMMARALEESFRHIPFENEPLIADIGAGMGETSQVMAEQGARVIATDINCIDLQTPRFITIGQPAGNLEDTVINARPMPPGSVRFGRLQCDSSLLPLASNTFDVVFSRGTWHHYVRLDEAVAECARILKPGGLLVACSEPLRAIDDVEIDYVGHVIDYQEGINEMAPTWPIYERAMLDAGFENLSVYGLYLTYGHAVNRRLSKWWNRFRKKSPGPPEGMLFEGQTLARLTDLAGCINFTAVKGSPSTPPLERRIPVGKPILPTRCLTSVKENLAEINSAYRKTFPMSLRQSCVTVSEGIPRFTAFGLRPIEEHDPPFAFCHRIARFLITPEQPRILLTLFAPEGQAEAGIVLNLFVNDKHHGAIALDWIGLKTMEIPSPQEETSVVEIRVEHDRLWSGGYPQREPVRELGVGFVSLHSG